LTWVSVIHWLTTAGSPPASRVARYERSCLLFRIDNLDAKFEGGVAGDAEILQEPVSQPWGCAMPPSTTRPANLVRISQA
jgi:hypothetical protein